MTDAFRNERLQFFLRNREDIKTWAAIEHDVIAATRELLAASQPSFEERLLAIDPGALVGRHDSGSWERILARHGRWPAAVGLTLEWHRSVDPLGANPPKGGVFWWADPPTLGAPRSRMVEMVDKLSLQKLGFKVPLEGVWPVGGYFKGGPDWWQDPDAFVASILDTLTAAWLIVAPTIDEVLVNIPEQPGEGESR
jgi:hypothetical protein